jgi:hypothetical protein
MISNPGDLMYYGVDANVKYSFMNLINSKVIDPSYMLVEVILFLETVATDINPGAGLAFWFTDKIGFLLRLPTKNHLEIEKMLMELLMLHLIFNILQVLLSNLEKRY